MEVQILNKLYEILEKIKKCPGLYIGHKSLNKLAGFISGYIVSTFELTGQWIPFSQFREYVEYRSGISDPSKHWSDIISKDKTPEEAFDLFFVYLDEFKELMNTPEVFEEMRNQNQSCTYPEKENS